MHLDVNILQAAGELNRLLVLLRFVDACSGSIVFDGSFFALVGGACVGRALAASCGSRGHGSLSRSGSDAAIAYANLGGGFAAAGAEALYRLHDVHSLRGEREAGRVCGGGKLSARLDDAAEDDVFAVKVRSWDSGDKELAAVGVRARVGHAHHPGARVFVLEVLVRKLGAVDALAARAVVVGEVAALP